MSEYQPRTNHDMLYRLMLDYTHDIRLLEEALNDAIKRFSGIGREKGITPRRLVDAYYEVVREIDAKK